jgi:hypothetical protein
VERANSPSPNSQKKLTGKVAYELQLVFPLDIFKAILDFRTVRLFGMSRLFPRLSLCRSLSTALAVGLLAGMLASAPRAFASCGDYLLHGDMSASPNRPEGFLKNASLPTSNREAPSQPACDGVHCSSQSFSPPPVVPSERELRVQSASPGAEALSLGDNSDALFEMSLGLETSCCQSSVFRPPR